MNKQNVKRVVCVMWQGTRFSVNEIYRVNPADNSVISRTEPANSAIAWYKYTGPSFRPAYKNDIEVTDVAYYRKYKILP